MLPTTRFALLVCCVFVAAAFSLPLHAQALHDGSFEGQLGGTLITDPWLEANGAVSFIETVAYGGFPTDGAKSLRLAPDLTGIYGLGCDQHPAYVGAWVSQRFGGCETVHSIALDWTWFNAEGPNQAIFNDFMAVRLHDGNGALLATLVYVDTRDGTLGNSPECTSAGVTLPLTFVSGEVAPVGPKHASLNLSSVPGYTPGMALELVLLVGNRGDAAISGVAQIDHIVVSETALSGAGQPNTPLARLDINGVGGGDCGGPFTFSIPGNGMCTMTFIGDPNQPFALFSSNAQFPAGKSLGCYGILNIGTPPYFGDLVIVYDGTAPGSTRWTDSTGRAVFIGNVPPGPFDINLQGLVFHGPGSGCVLSLTAAIYAHVQ